MRALAILGTASDVGKSLIATALGRLLSDAGFDPVPFKAQNMSLQAGVTAEGGEMSRAQLLQARACRVTPHVDMNPVLLKPTTERDAEVVVLGQARGRTSARAYFQGENDLGAVADAALDRLAARHRVVVIEGAGSPVELNLMARDFVNLRPARRLNAGIVLVADIDRGGVFAQVKGTLDLLPAADRRRVLGVVVNRFRGDPELFTDGITRLEEIAGCPVLAVVPWLSHGLDEEDRPLSLPIDAPPHAGALNVAVVLHPHVANTDDLAPLSAEPDVAATWVTHGGALGARDLVILPGSKATVADLQHHAASGLAQALRAAHAAGAWMLGLCAGYQMLGRRLIDPEGTDGAPGVWPGLGLLDVETTFAARKHLSTTGFQSRWPTSGHALTGYEIHHGRTAGDGTALVMEADASVGVVGERAVGCYLHGLLRADGWRCDFLNRVRASRGLPAQPPAISEDLELRIARFARHVAAALRPGAWEALVG
ncbi:MAG TPA: cobyric acid synthase [Polyangia bacterium]|jgi:adenosylcobyric acid synthase|nr:cobyric acid synthase [Polyangia bacterium]